MTLTLTGFIRDVITPVGIATLSMTFDDEPRTKTLMVPFMVVELPSAYNVIIGRPTFNKLQVVVSMYHRNMKFPTNTGAGEARSDPRESTHRSRFSLRLASDVSGVKFSILRVGKTTYGSRIASMPKARLASRLQPRPPCKGATARRGSSPHTTRCQRPARKRLLARGEVARAAPAHSQPAEGQLPAGKASRRLCRGIDSDVGSQRGQEG
ncbi:hypothetical protein BHM03_00044559 [Ensete ventricosum]|nr:hypothetical protein BHM03_00044559 [Ensete ventricosum]